MRGGVKQKLYKRQERSKMCFMFTNWGILALAREDGETGAVAPGGAYVRGTKYDVRFGEFPRLRADLAERMRSGIVKQTSDVVGRRRRWQAAPAYVRCTIFDVQHARRPQAAARQLLIYDV